MDAVRNGEAQEAGPSSGIALIMFMRNVRSSLFVNSVGSQGHTPMFVPLRSSPGLLANISKIGGGFKEHDLSDLTLFWMAVRGGDL